MATSVRPTNVPRVTMLMQTSMLNSSIRSNTVDLLKVQNQLTTGLRLARPSDSPAEATTIMHLDSMLERQRQYLSNISFAEDFMSTTDNALSDVVELLDRAYTLASDAVSNPDGREADLVEIDQIIEQLISIGNRSCRDSYIFGGHNTTQEPFVTELNGSAMSGVVFRGTANYLSTSLSDHGSVNFSARGDETFGALSSEVVGIADLDPALTTDTLLSDLNGALNQGIRLGSIIVSDGTSSQSVDLAGCVTLGDVIRKIDSEVAFVSSVGIAADGNSLQITTAGTTSVSNVGGGNTAGDLGIAMVAGGAVLDGQDVDARLSLATPVSALAGGVGIDLINGLIITNSAVSPIGPIDLSTAQTVGDILNAITFSGVGAYAEINTAGDGINVINTISGSRMTIGENGGTTAEDLGVRSMSGSAALADLNGGKGVHTTDAVIQIQNRAGTTYDVDISAATTVQDVIDAINAVGGTVTASLATTGNGIVLTDTSVGANTLQVTELVDNDYFYAEELGLAGSGATVVGNQLFGADVNPIEPDGLFSHLLALSETLRINDSQTVVRSINAAAAAIDTDRQRIRNVHGRIGAQARALENRKIYMEDNMLATEELRSNIRDIDFTEAITRYQNLYTALQANLMSGGMINNTSLLDFLG